MNAYLAAPIFTEKDKQYNTYLAESIRSAYPALNLYVPQENAAINDKTKCATAAQIYDADYERLSHTDLLICHIDNDVPPAGTVCEIGIFSEMAKNDPKKRIIALYTDSRDPAFTYSDAKAAAMRCDSASSQFSYFNLFVLGAIQRHGVVVNSSPQLFELLAEFAAKEGDTTSTAEDKLIYYYDPLTRIRMGGFDTLEAAAQMYPTQEEEMQKAILSALIGERYYAGGFIWSALGIAQLPANYKELNKAHVRGD